MPGLAFCCGLSSSGIAEGVGFSGVLLSWANAGLGPGSWPCRLAMRVGSTWQVEDSLEACYFFLLSRTTEIEGATKQR